jgi:hypothetical protein
VGGENCAIYSHQKALAWRDFVLIGLRLFETFRLVKDIEMYYLFRGLVMCSRNISGAFFPAVALGDPAASSLAPHGNTVNFSMD